jgi:hypothetical protein
VSKETTRVAGSELYCAPLASCSAWSKSAGDGQFPHIQWARRKPGRRMFSSGSAATGASFEAGRRSRPAPSGLCSGRDCSALRDQNVGLAKPLIRRIAAGFLTTRAASAWARVRTVRVPEPTSSKTEKLVSPPTRTRLERSAMITSSSFVPAPKLVRIPELRTTSPGRLGTFWTPVPPEPPESQAKRRGSHVARGRGVGLLDGCVLARLRGDSGPAAQARNRVEDGLAARGIDHPRLERGLVDGGSETANLPVRLPVEISEVARGRGAHEVVARGLAEVTLEHRIGAALDALSGDGRQSALDDFKGIVAILRAGDLARVAA